MRKLQVIKVKNYDYDWVNRLAVIDDQFGKMESPNEVAATLYWINSKYGPKKAAP